MNYLINLSEGSDHLLRQLHDRAQNSAGASISVEDFLSALVEEHLDELFPRREARKTNSKTNKEKKLDDAVWSAKERARLWRGAATASHASLEAMRQIVRHEGFPNESTSPTH